MRNSGQQGNENSVLDGFVSYLRQHDFKVGVTHYLRAHQLVEGLGDASDPEDLKTLLCPVFAKNQNEQRRFYALFDEYTGFLERKYKPAVIKQPDTKEPERHRPVPKPSRTLLYGLVTSLLASSAVIAIYFLFFYEAQTINPYREPPSITSPNANNSNTEKDNAGGDSIPAPVKQSPNTSQASEGNQLPFYNYLVVIIAGLVFLMLYEYFTFISRKLLLDKQQKGKSPPFRWSIHIEKQVSNLFGSESFYRATRFLRRRQADEFNRLDVKSTIAATIKSLGYLRLRYKFDSRAPEYLVLIDRASFRDHQARLFDAMVDAMRRENVFIHRYFYNADPRLCWDEEGKTCTYLVDLKNRYLGDRLLIFGDGEMFFNARSGEMDAWTNIFLDWPDRALLTPASQWGLREKQLSTRFIILPSNSEGLLSLVDYFESPQARNFSNWVNVRNESFLLESAPLDMSQELRAYLGGDTFQWLCATAVYPELHWDLTLRLGSLPCMAKDLMSEENLLRLSCLPWFRTGLIPDELRWVLINGLDKEKLKDVRKTIIKMLRKNPPPENTFAADAYQLELALQFYFYHPTNKGLNRLNDRISEQPLRQILSNKVLVGYLKSLPTSVLGIKLPDFLRNTFYKSGIPSFGFKHSARLLATICIIAIVSFGISAGILPPFIKANQQANTNSPTNNNYQPPEDIPPNNNQSNGNTRGIPNSNNNNQPGRVIPNSNGRLPACPTVRLLNCGQDVTEGETITIRAEVFIPDDSALRPGGISSLDYLFTADGVRVFPDNPSAPNIVRVSTQGKGGRSIQVTVTVSLPDRLRSRCTTQATCSIKVNAKVNPSEPTGRDLETRTAPDLSKITKLSSTAWNRTFLLSKCLVRSVDVVFKDQDSKIADITVHSRRGATYKLPKNYGERIVLSDPLMTCDDIAKAAKIPLR